MTIINKAFTLGETYECGLPYARRLLLTKC